MNPRAAAALAIGLVMAVAGCGSGQGSRTPDGRASGSASPSPSSPPPTAGPTSTPTPPKNPPKTPTDQVGTEWVVGTATKDSKGPCYGLVTDDGVQFALYGGGIALRKGERMRAKIGPLKLKIYCGPGRHASIIELRPVR
jgi:hypothetical protein